MNRKVIYGCSFLAGVACTSILLTLAQRPTVSPTARPVASNDLRKPTNEPSPATPVTQQVYIPVEIPLIPEPARRSKATNVSSPVATATAAPILETHLNDPVVKEQLGRVALSFVGSDPDANVMWLWAINDPSLPDESRKNLIEDLNEDGFPNPRSPTQDDLPLIANRIALIEELAPQAMDDVNAAAFAEAYKDLVNMWGRVTGR